MGKQNKFVSKLILLQFNDKNIVTSLNKVDIGPKARLCITAAALADGASVSKEKTFRENFLNCFQNGDEHLKKLPFNEFIGNLLF